MAAVYFLTTGLTYFVGAAGLGLAALLCSGSRRAWRLGRLAATIIAVALVAVSGTPAPLLVFVIGGVALLAWLLASSVERLRRAAWLPNAARAMLVLVVLLAVGLEWPHHRTPVLPPAGHTRLWVIGDSLSAGIGDGVEPWPVRLQREHGLAVTNLSVAGANTAGGRAQAGRLPDEDGIVIVAIGGNDIIGGRAAGDFERDLDYVLSRASSRRRPVVMLEMPLPPLGSEYGRVQRRLARRYDVALVPKHTLAMMLAQPGATTDGVHLSDSGQAALAGAVWRIVGPACTGDGGAVGRPAGG